MAKRALCLTSNFPRWQGDSTTPFVLNLARDLAEFDWQVDVVAPHFPGAAREEVLDGVRVNRFRYLLPESAQTVCYQGGAMVNLRSRPVEKLKLPGFVLAEWLTTQRRLWEERYDIIHSHWVLPQGFVGQLASRIATTPNVVTVHGGDLFTLRGSVMSAFKAHALRRAAAVTVNSSFTESATRALAQEAAITRIPMGVNVDPLSDDEHRLARTLRERYRSGDGPLLLFVGRLVEEKGAGDLLEAFGTIVRRHPNARLLFAGEGPLRRRLEEDISSRGLSSQVTCLGWVQPSSLRSHLAAADIFVGPSKTGRDGWVEAQGLTFVEAMAVGTAVIGTCSGGIVDSVIHERTGLLVEEGQPARIVEAVDRLTTDPALRQALAHAGAEFAKERFSRSGSARAFSDLFGRVIERRVKLENPGRGMKR